MNITTVGIDLAKNVFQVHGIDQHGKVVLKKQLKRAQVAPFFRQPFCLLDRDRSLRQRSSLGAQAADDGSHRAIDGPAIRQALRKG